MREDAWISRGDRTIWTGYDWTRTFFLQEQGEDIPTLLTGASATFGLYDLVAEQEALGPVSCAIDADHRTITVTLTGAQTSALPVGSYTAELILTLSGGERHLVLGQSATFHVRNYRSSSPSP